MPTTMRPSEHSSTILALGRNAMAKVPGQTWALDTSTRYAHRPSFDQAGTDILLPRPLTEYLPTLAITLTTGEGQECKTLIGIRSAVNNSNHPDVVSVPTMRQPVQSARGLICDLLAEGPLTSILQPSIAHRPLGFAIWSMLAAKLSLGDPIEAKQFDLTVQDFAIVQGQSSLTDPETGEERFESLTMINCLANITKGVDLIPANNATFSHMSFERYEALERVALTKDLAELGSAYAGLQTCIHGLCIASAIVLKSAPFTHCWATQSDIPRARLGVQWLGYGTSRDAA
jgi:hypothetical protein